MKSKPSTVTSIEKHNHDLRLKWDEHQKAIESMEREIKIRRGLQRRLEKQEEANYGLYEQLSKEQGPFVQVEF